MCSLLAFFYHLIKEEKFPDLVILHNPRMTKEREKTTFFPQDTQLVINTSWSYDLCTRHLHVPEMTCGWNDIAPSFLSFLEKCFCMVVLFIDTTDCLSLKSVSLRCVMHCSKSGLVIPWIGFLLECSVFSGACPEHSYAAVIKGFK